MIDKQKFEEKYCKDSDITLQEYRESFITMPCNCGDKKCLGWSCVNNDELSIKNHKNLYN